MPRSKRTGGPPCKRPIERYEHTDKQRINNPQVGLVTPETDPVAPTRANLFAFSNHSTSLLNKENSGALRALFCA